MNNLTVEDKEDGKKINKIMEELTPEMQFYLLGYMEALKDSGRFKRLTVRRSRGNGSDT